MSLKLYELTESYISALDLFTDPEQSFNDDLIADTLESIELSFDDKVIQTACVIKSMQAEAEAIKAAIAPMLARQKAIENRADGIKEYLLRNMQQVGKKQVTSPWLTVSVQKSPPALNVLDESRVPDIFKHEIVTVKIDKVAIKSAWSDSSPIAGCSVTQDENLRIR
jgi:hypothetical protein